VRKRPVQVRFVGCGDAFGSGGRFQACILLHAPGHNGDVLLDCGASSLIALKQQRQDPNQIGLVLVSHLHGDHFGGLPFLILDGQFTHRTRPLYVAGPAGVGQRVQAAMEVLFPGSTGVRRRFPVHFHQLTDRQPLRFDPAPTVIGYRVGLWRLVGWSAMSRGRCLSSGWAAEAARWLWRPSR
jgi:ribonuclease BN (tRNA processing enzyme)